MNFKINLRSIGFVLITAFSSGAYAQQATAVQVDVSTINSQLTLSPEEVLSELDKIMAKAGSFITNTAHATQVMAENIELSKQVVASCELRTEGSITGYVARQGYILACSTGLNELKQISAKYSAITDELTEFLPVANKFLEDGDLTRKQVLLIIRAQKANMQMKKVVDNVKIAKDDLANSL